MTHFLPPTVQKPSDFKNLIKDAQEPYKNRPQPFSPTSKTPEVSQLRDEFETPNYAVDILVPFIPNGITHIWECAAGGGKIVKRLEYHGFKVGRTDIRTYDGLNIYHNFLADIQTMWTLDSSMAIITNPPFSVKELFVYTAFEYNIPFAFLINADYSGQIINWIERGCEKIVPKQRIAFITPRIIQRVNDGEGTDYKSKDEIPSKLIYKYSSAQFHSMWLTYGFGIGRTETFVDLPVDVRKNNI